MFSSFFNTNECQPLFVRLTCTHAMQILCYWLEVSVVFLEIQASSRFQHIFQCIRIKV